MALIHCSECNGTVSDQALMCPHCGFGFRKNIENKFPEKKFSTSYQNIINIADVPQAQDERRAHQRINIKMMAKINHETARICNLSKSGMKLSTPAVHPDPNVEIMLDNGETIITVKGTIRWVSGKRSFSSIVDLGVEISDAPPEYGSFIDQLLANQGKHDIQSPAS